MQILPTSSTNGLRALVADERGVVIAETVYRCMVCSLVSSTLEETKLHFNIHHLDDVVKNVFTRPEKSISNLMDYQDDNYEEDEGEKGDDAALELENLFNQNGIIESPDHNMGNSYSAEIELEPAHFNFDSESESFHSPDEQVDETTLEPVKQVGFRGGKVTCEVCGMTKYYSHISRRFGVHSCESCAKFFYRHRTKPVEYHCQFGGNCYLNTTVPGGRCKACLLKACQKTYIVDPLKHPKIFETESNASSKENANSFGTNAAKSSKQKSISPSISATKDTSLHSLLSSTGVKKKQQLSFPTKIKIGLPNGHSSSIVKNKGGGKRRAACRQCTGCLADDCGDCLYCKDKPKFGGMDVKKQKCLKRRCHYLKSQHLPTQ